MSNQFNNTQIYFIENFAVVYEFRTSSKECCEQGYGWVRAKLWRPEAHQNDRSYVHEVSGLLDLRFNMQEFSMHGGGYTEDLNKPQNCQILGCAIARRWALA